jgi:formamidopyrimidine-DNA glycosylase
MDLDDGSEVLFTDVRRFGTAVFLPDSEALGEYLAPRVGVEPLSAELTPEAMGRMAAGRTAPLKSFLLTQTGVAGIGNIYADEALHRAGLHPLSPAGSMKREHCEALVEGIVDALETGLAEGGASIDDYRDARGERGSMQDEFLVHTREGLPCPRCGASAPEGREAEVPVIERIVVGGRSTYFCPVCQVKLRKRPRRRKRRTRKAVA